MSTYNTLRNKLHSALEYILYLNTIDKDGDPLGILIQNTCDDYFLLERYNAYIRLKMFTIKEDLVFSDAEFESLLNMIGSVDIENTHVARAVIDQKLNEIEQRINPQSMSRSADDALVEEHNRYIKEVLESGLPLWMANYYHQISIEQQEHEHRKSNQDESNSQTTKHNNSESDSHLSI